MFFDAPIFGDRLPERTLSLTFDDGPGQVEGPGRGPRTLEIARYLHARGIAASFFVIGQRARTCPEIVREMHAMGHLVCNHAESHEDLRGMSLRGHDPAPSVLATNQFLHELLGLEYTFFRPPYGYWRPERQTTSPVASLLNHEPALNRCIGPIEWDIDGRDWAFWNERSSPEACAQSYLEAIDAAGRGIVLMHDSSWETRILEGHEGLRMLQILIPELIAHGYRFVRLDEVPQVQSAVLVSRRISLADVRSAKRLSIDCRRRGLLVAGAESPDDGGEFGLVTLEGGHIALRGSNGRFLAVSAGADGQVFADAAALGDDTLFQIEEFAGNQIAIRSLKEARYLTCEDVNDGLVLASTSELSGAARLVLSDR